MIKASTIAITPNLFANKNVEYNDQINSVRFNISSKNKYMIADARFLLNGING